MTNIDTDPNELKVLIGKRVDLSSMFHAENWSAVQSVVIGDKSYTVDEAKELFKTGKVGDGGVIHLELWDDPRNDLK